MLCYQKDDQMNNVISNRGRNLLQSQEVGACWIEDENEYVKQIKLLQ